MAARLRRLPRLPRQTRVTRQLIPSSGALTPAEFFAYLQQTTVRPRDAGSLAPQVDDLDLDELVTPFADLVLSIEGEFDRLADIYEQAFDDAQPREDALDVRADQDASDLPGPLRRGINRLVDRLKGVLDRSLDRLTSGVNRAYEALHDRRWRRGTERVFGREIDVDAEEVLREYNADLVRRMQKLPTYLRERTASDLLEAWRAGRSPGQVRGLMVERLGITERQAARSARDHLVRLNERLTQHRQESIGVTRYIWETQQDDRVRPTHRANQGKTFSWDDPPSETGHPGSEPNCRCWPRPILEDIVSAPSATA